MKLPHKYIFLAKIYLIKNHLPITKENIMMEAQHIYDTEHN